MANEEAKKERSSYGLKVPLLSFEEAIEVINEANRNEGETGSILTIAQATGGSSTNSSTFNYKLSALKNFGLLKSQIKSTRYEMSDLAKDIVNSESPSQRSFAIQNALIQHDLLNKVWLQYQGKTLPVAEYLANVIERNFNVPKELKNKWAEYIIHAFQYAELVYKRSDGTLQLLPEFGAQGTKREETNESVSPIVETPKAVSSGLKYKTAIADTMLNSLESEEWGINYKRTLSSGKKMYIYIPEPLSESDVNSIRQILKSVDTGIDGLKGEVLNFENGPQ